MTDTVGFPTVLAALAVVTEFVAPIALIAGIGGRIAAAGVVGLMIGAASAHAEHGFFMNWDGALPAGAEGYEYHLLVIAIALAIVIRGSGAWSIDGWLHCRGSRADRAPAETVATPRVRRRSVQGVAG